MLIYLQEKVQYKNKYLILLEKGVIMQNILILDENNELCSISINGLATELQLNIRRSWFR